MRLASFLALAAAVGAAVPDRAQITSAPQDNVLLAARDDADTSRTGNACLTKFQVTAESLVPVTVNGKVHASTSTVVREDAQCTPGWMCSPVLGDTTSCVKKHNSLDIGGIIVSIVFGAAIVAGISFLLIMSCKDKRTHKRASAKAEANALARAATKRKRAADARAPLMENQQQQYQQSDMSMAQAQYDGAANPFQDQYNQQQQQGHEYGSHGNEYESQGGDGYHVPPQQHHS